MKTYIVTVLNKVTGNYYRDMEISARDERQASIGAKNYIRDEFGASTNDLTVTKTKLK